MKKLLMVSDDRRRGGRIGCAGALHLPRTVATLASASGLERNCGPNSLAPITPKSARCGTSILRAGRTSSPSRRPITASESRSSPAAASRSVQRLISRAAARNSDVGAPVGKVKTTIEAGAFANYEVSNPSTFAPRLLKGIGGHKGVVGTLGARLYLARRRPLCLLGRTAAAVLRFSRYQRAYFGVSPEAALASGLPAYRPSGGIHGVAMASGISYQFERPFGAVRLWARTSGLVGDAAQVADHSRASARATSCRADSG